MKIAKKEYVTKPRTLMMEYLKANQDKRISAAEVHSYLLENDRSVNLATVYRNLDKLTEDGNLIKFKMVDNNCCLYQYVDKSHNCHEHLHLQCKNCGKIIHLECDFMKEIAGHVSMHHGFNIECEGSVIVGMCAECNK